jgi:hypothetical protein
MTVQPESVSGQACSSHSVALRRRTTCYRPATGGSCRLQSSSPDHMRSFGRDDNPLLEFLSAFVHRSNCRASQSTGLNHLHQPLSPPCPARAGPKILRIHRRGQSSPKQATNLHMASGIHGRRCHHNAGEADTMIPRVQSGEIHMLRWRLLPSLSSHQTATTSGRIMGDAA